MPCRWYNESNTYVKVDVELASKIPEDSPSYVDITIVDGMFFLHLLKDLPATFGNCARVILAKLCAINSSRIEIVFDKIIRPSIKDCQRDKRSSDDRTTTFNITDPSQKRPVNFLQALRNDSFKDSLVKFLLQQWQEHHFTSIIGNKEIYTNYNDDCYLFKSVSGQIIKEEIYTLHCEQEEVDSRMIFHMQMAQNHKNIVIRNCDTDVL